MAAAEVDETWQHNKSVLERNKYMLENQLATDVTFLVGEKPARRIPAHQYMLISGSPVFYSMFCGDMKERGEVKIPDITPDVFTQMLRYLYYEEADITGESVMQIMYCANKYLIQGLIKMCTDFLEENMSGENVAVILEQCLMFDEKQMVKKCMKVIGEETAEVLNSEGFGKISNATLVKILENNNSSVSEIDLFKGSLDWARIKMAKKKPSGDMVRSTLGKALFNLRFPVMTTDEFADEVAPTDILTKEEENLCFRYLNTLKKKPISMPFPTEPRVDNSCPYIHLRKDKNEGYFIMSKQGSWVNFTIQNNTSNDLAIKGFVPYEMVSVLYQRNSTACVFTELRLQTQLAGVCAHNKGKACITFPAFTIPAGNTFKIRLDSASAVPMSCTSADSGINFTNPTGVISVVVEGEIYIKEILIAKSKT